jgi:hypothetical protein
MKTLKEVEKLTGIKWGTLYNRIWRGSLKGIRKGYQWFLSEKTIKELLEE